MIVVVFADGTAWTWTSSSSSSSSSSSFRGATAITNSPWKQVCITEAHAKKQPGKRQRTNELQDQELCTFRTAAYGGWGPVVHFVTNDGRWIAYDTRNGRHREFLSSVTALGIGRAAQELSSLTEDNHLNVTPNHALAVDTNGNLHALGRNAYGELGSDDRTNNCVPRIVTSLRPFQVGTQLACGSFHSMVSVLSDMNVDSTGSEYNNLNTDLYSMGWNRDGQLGRDSNEFPSHHPIPVDIQNSCSVCTAEDVSPRISWLSCGSRHTAFVGSCAHETSVYACGWNQYGQCGGINDETTKDEVFRRVSLERFGLPNSRILALACGLYSTVIVVRR
jgi:alpha-tubulin suppressor-like RCC1 family protein